MKQQKRLLSFIDKVAEKTRQNRAKHKGGFVPAKKRKINVDFYPTSGSDLASGDDEHMNDGEKQDGDGKKTVEMYDLHLPKGTVLKAYTRQEEERRRIVAKMRKQGLDFEDPLKGQENKNLPQEPLVQP